MASLSKAAKTALTKCMALKKKESLLIVTDSKKKKLAKAFLKEAEKICDNCRLVEIPIGNVHGEEPPKNIASELKKCDVAFLITTKSLSHTKARKDACKAGVRITSMPGITGDMAKRAIDVDYNKISKLNKRLCRILTKGNRVKVKNNKGTDLEFGIKGRKCFDGNGLYAKKGSFGNLPSGEVCLAPLEGTTNGTLIVDESVGGLGKVDKKIIIQIKGGYMAAVKGGRIAKKFKSYFKKKKYCQVAELGIGTNPKARAKGTTLEDEKVLGTAHVAFGNNLSFGGNINVPLHLDCVFSKPTIFVDGKLIMKNGKFR
jgi:leucyl aminopeptidase (aminopeptidase T)